MAKSSNDTSNKTQRNKQASRQKIVKSGEPRDDALSEDELKKVSGGPIYMHGSGGGAG